jgi:multicomponent Na+:H+ antiporter subunit E
VSGLLWNVLLAVAWAAITGSFALPNLLLGFVLGLLVLFFARRVVGAPAYVHKVWQVIALAVYFLWELVLANLRVAYDVLTPAHHMRPGVIGIPLDATTDAEITLLANLITLTPGTLSLDVAADRRTLYIHAMYLGDIDAERRKIKNGFERRVLAVLR